MSGDNPNIPNNGGDGNFDYFNQVACFLEDTKILCLKNDKEVYRPIQYLRPGDLVKTTYDGYVPINKIGTCTINNPGDDERIKDRLYKCSPDKYPDLMEDLYITGCHSILVWDLTDEQREKTEEMLGRIFVTDRRYRLMACVDDNAVPFKRNNIFNIYHIALEHENYYMNYGVYANGLLVETCSNRYITEHANMKFLT